MFAAANARLIFTLNADIRSSLAIEMTGSESGTWIEYPHSTFANGIHLAKVPQNDDHPTFHVVYDDEGKNPIAKLPDEKLGYLKYIGQGVGFGGLAVTVLCAHSAPKNGAPLPFTVFAHFDTHTTFYSECLVAKRWMRKRKTTHISGEVSCVQSHPFGLPFVCHFRRVVNLASTE